MATTYEKIASSALSSAATVTFSSIPQTYTDLRIVQWQIGDYGNPYFWINNDTAASYSNTFIQSNGSAAGSGTNTNTNQINSGQSSTSTYGVPIFTTTDIFSYTGSTYKSCLSTQAFDRNGAGRITQTASLYRSTTAITRLDINIGAGGSYTGYVTLYGIKAA
jgi:hypothetical protein